MGDRLHRMRAGSKLGWVLAAESGILLVLPFPVAGPLPHWRAGLAWIALIPLLIALLVPKAAGFQWPRVGRNVLLGYFCGILWYGGTCYWIESTMRLYGNFSPVMASVLLLLFCLYLGLYFALFAFLVSLSRRATGSTAWTLVVTPFIWVAMELARARITSFPWNQFGDSQIDNLLLVHLAPWTGSYGISFILVAVNCAIASLFLLRGWRTRLVPATLGIAAAVGLSQGYGLHATQKPARATVMLVQPNLNVGGGNNWTGTVFDMHMQHLAMLSEDVCNPYFQGLPIHSSPTITPDCTPKRRVRPVANLIVWPESPAPFEDGDPHFRHWVSALAEDAKAPMIVGDIAVEKDAGQTAVYNSAAFVAPDGRFVGRYDKMHLVPFGEYTPFPQLFSFAGSLTDEVGHMTPGKHRVLFAVNDHRYGVFICYESIFADEVRRFVKQGADVLVNISDDGWYGDTSAPWQHLNMTRMRAVENDRWVLVATNSGVTAAIDPHGQVVQSLPRHERTSLLARFNYESAQTFYTRYGDVFAWLCAIIAIVLALDGAVHGHSR